MPLQSLPGELILLIAEYLDVKDLNFFIQTHSSLNGLLTPLLHKHAILPFNGLSTLSIAAIGGHLGLAIIALSKGVDVNHQNRRNGRTALHYAAECGNAPLVLLLLQHGANVSSRCYDKITPLHLCLTEDSEATSLALLEAGADLTAEDSYGRTPLRWAIDHGSEAAIKLFLEHEKNLSSHSRSYFGLTVLQEACGIIGKEWVVRLLLERGASVSAVDLRTGGTALHWAARAGREAVVRLLLANGADVGARDFVGDTAVDWAARADLDARTRRGMLVKTCSVWSLPRSCTKVIEVLLDNGATLAPRFKT